MYECAVHFDALHLICHVFDFSHAFVILYLLVIDAIKNILNFELLKREMSRTTGVSQDAIKNVLRCDRGSSGLTQGLRRHLLNTITSKEDHALLRISRRKSFLSAVQDQGTAHQANWTPYRCPHGSRTSSSGWISLKTSRLMSQTDSSSSLPPTHVGRYTPKLEPSVLVSFDFRWWVQGQHLPLWSSCLRIPSVSWMQQSTSLSTTRRYSCRGWLWTHQQIAHGTSADGSSWWSGDGQESAWGIGLDV